jgi:hypothetical protein
LKLDSTKIISKLVKIILVVVILICTVIVIFICCFCSIIFWYRKFKNVLRLERLAQQEQMQSQYGAMNPRSIGSQSSLMNYESAIQNSQAVDRKETENLPAYDSFVKFNV